MKRAWSALSLSVIAATLTFGVSAAPASAAENHPCGTTAPDQDPSPLAHFDDYPGVINIRTGTGSLCSITGTVDRLEAINFHCYVTDAIGRTWTYLRTSSGDLGWVLDSELPLGGGLYGSQVPCSVVNEP
ncbi:hypothetical protein ACWCPT_32290 [Streptomyces sp. NPDC002308]